MRAVIFALMLALGAVTVSAGTLADRVAHASVDELRELLRSPAPGEPPGDLFLLRALLEPSASISARLLEQADSAAHSPRLSDVILSRLADAYRAINDTSALDSLYRRLRSDKRDRSVRVTVGLIAVRSFSGSSTSERERWLSADLESHNRSEDKELFLLLRAVRQSERKPGNSRLQQLLISSTARSERVAVPAAIALANEELATGRVDDALVTYQLVREKNPDAIGLEQLREKFSGENPAQGTDTRAEELTGTYYVVQFGVFADKRNAESAALSLKKYRLPLKQEQRQIAGKKYTAVLIGRFPTFAKAAQFRDTLARETGDTYQVIAQ